MSVNLKYSINLVEDYKKLSTGRKLYIVKCAIKKEAFVPLGSRIWAIKSYLTKKYGAAS